MKLYLTVEVDFDNAESQSQELEFTGLKDDATVLDCPQKPILNAVRELSSAGSMRGYAVTLTGHSTED